MELRVFGGTVLCVGRNAGGESDYHAQSGTRFAHAGGRIGAQERESVFRIAAATEGGSGGTGTHRSATWEDSVRRGVRQQERLGNGVIERAETAGSVRHPGLRGG